MPATARHYIAVRKRSVLALLLGALVLTSACSIPIGVVRGDRHTMYRSLTSSVFSKDELSAGSAQVLNRLPAVLVLHLQQSHPALGQVAAGRPA
jgi:hypothetical protein